MAAGEILKDHPHVECSCMLHVFTEYLLLEECKTSFKRKEAASETVPWAVGPAAKTN